MCYNNWLKNILKNRLQQDVNGLKIDLKWAENRFKID